MNATGIDIQFEYSYRTSTERIRTYHAGGRENKYEYSYEYVPRRQVPAHYCHSTRKGTGIGAGYQTTVPSHRIRSIAREGTKAIT
eukprot:scaffold613814_cov22-Prasinocladus_malaysianus.AAC.1